MKAAARVRALVLIASVLDPPGIGPLTRRLTRVPRRETLHVDGVPVDLWLPRSGRPSPAWVFVNGAHPERRREPVVLRLAEGLARAGFVVAVPDVPGLGEGTVTRRSLDAAIAVARAVSRHPAVAGGRVALVGASTGAGIALVAAAHPALAARVSAVAAIVPYGDIRKLLCLTTTCTYEEAEGFTAYAATELHRAIVAKSLLAALAPSVARDELLGEAARMERSGIDPLDELHRRAGSVPDEVGAVLALLANRQPARFADLYAALPPEVHTLVDDLSPLRVASQVRAHVEIIAPPHDVYFPAAEACALAAALPSARLTVTPVLDHTRPGVNRRTLGGLRDFDGFVVRGLAAAAPGRAPRRRPRRERAAGAGKAA